MMSPRDTGVVASWELRRMPKLVSQIHDPHYTWLVANAALRKYSQEAEGIGRSDQNLKNC